MGDVIQEVAAETVRALPDLALGTRTGRPKAWGALAGHGVTALRATWCISSADSFTKTPTFSTVAGNWATMSATEAGSTQRGLFW